MATPLATRPARGRHRLPQARRRTAPLMGLLWSPLLLTFIAAISHMPHPGGA